MAELGGVIGRIAAAKREEIASRYDGVSLDALRSRAPATERSLTRALAQPGARFILELKRGSPSGGMMHSTTDAAAVARGYAGVADAMSVLCDGPFFGGSVDDLRAARGAFDGPILAKDFFFDLRQVAEARVAGADAILVMLSLLDDTAAREMVAEAARFRMEVLVEVHDEVEMRRALALGAPLIGINNRDLCDLSVDLATTERLASLARGSMLVAESGIGSRADVARLSGYVDGVLVGSSLMRSGNPAQAAREMVFGRTKFCGLNRRADLEAARPASLAGFVFVPGTPRYLTADEATPLADHARKSGMLPVGVFRNAPLSTLVDIAKQLNLNAVQLHGDEGHEYVRSLRRELPSDCEIWTALSAGREPLVRRGGDRLVFDNGDGGSGRCFDWRLVGGHPELPRAILAGGIGPSNARAARDVGAYAIDVGSSVDFLPGRKCPAKIAALFEALRAASCDGLARCA